MSRKQVLPLRGQPKPVCATCGSGYGKRNTTTERLKLPLDTPVPHYQGNLLLVAHRVWTSTVPVDGETPERFAKQLVVERTLWDGAWSTPYNPFCTLRCGLVFARAAHRQGMRYGAKARVP